MGLVKWKCDVPCGTTQWYFHLQLSFDIIGYLIEPIIQIISFQYLSLKFGNLKKFPSKFGKFGHFSKKNLFSHVKMKPFKSNFGESFPNVKLPMHKFIKLQKLYRFFKNFIVGVW
jgi:hypothetical protein